MADPLTDCIFFGLAGNRVLTPRAEPFMAGASMPERTRTDHEIDYRAGSWPGEFFTILKAAVMARGDNPRFVVTSLDLSGPECVCRDQCVCRDLHCARGQDENFVKMIKNDLASDRTSDSSVLANQMRLFFPRAADTLHQTLRTEVLAGTELANA